jgi:hypothetical protein
MSQATVHAIELAIACVVFALVVLRLGRLGRISFRYTMGWLALAAIGVFAALLVPLVEPVAAWLRLSPTALLVALASLGSAALFVQLTISISGSQRRMDSLTQENALLRERVARLEGDGRPPNP